MTAAVLAARRIHMVRMGWRAWMSVGVGLIAIGLNASARQDDLRGRMAELLRYTGIERAAPEDVARMTELWSRAQEPKLAPGDRAAAFRDMYTLYAKLRGRDMTAQSQRVGSLAQLATATVEAGGRMDLALPEPRGKPSGKYLHVETRGHGPARLLLISDFGIDGRALYGSFAKRQDAAYTMDIVTLPYAGAARSLPWPERLDYAAGPWLTQIERELVALVDLPRMTGVTIVGTSAGGYFAARLALLRPKRIRAVVLVNALVNTPLPSPDDPKVPATLAQRLEAMKSVAPTPQLVPIAPVPPPGELKRLIADPASTHQTARNWMAFAVKDAATSAAWTFAALSGGFLVPSLEYRWELSSTDLTEPLRELGVPMLAMGSRQDEGSPAVNPPSIPQWEAMKRRYPEIPLRIVAFDDSRAYLSEDAPQQFDHVLADFVASH
jgi:pimeloyl-ACP methyl ester carboxylesterase